MPVMRRFVVCGVVGLWPALAGAQTSAPAAQPVAVSSTPASAPVDTSALAYYASKHDTARVEAELRRLRSLYPNWQPPADPMALTAEPGGDSDVQPLWDLFGANKLDELDAEIARRKAADPSWSPPVDLVAKLALKRTRQALITTSDRRDYQGVLDLVARNPDLLSPDDLDVSWRVAEAYGRTGAPDKAVKINEDLLAAKQDPAERLATVRKAMMSLPPEDVDKLVNLGKPTPGGKSEFDAVDLDLVRQRVGHVLGDASPDSAAPADVAKLETAASRPNDATDAALLGWLYSKKKDWTRANSWFQAALKATPDPAKAKPDDAKVAQGAAIALRENGHPAEAEQLAYTWRDADPALALLYVGSVTTDLTKPKPPAIDADRLKRFSDVVLALQSGDGAQALGWYAYNVGQYKPALAWFQKALTWQPRDTTALGLALSLKQNGEKEMLADFLKDNSPTFPALASLADGSPRTRISRVQMDKAAQARPVRTTMRVAEALADLPDVASEDTSNGVRPRRLAERATKACTAAPRSSSPASALKAGWCLMSLDRPQEAAIAFAAARKDSATRVDASYGQALADLRSNRTDEAVAAADSLPQTEKRRAEIGLAALAQSAARSFDEGRYKDTLKALDKRRMFEAEPRDLAILRAWSTYHTDHREEAHALFSTLDAQLSTSESRAGIAAASATSRY